MSVLQTLFFMKILEIPEPTKPNNENLNVGFVGFAVGF